LTLSESTATDMLHCNCSSVQLAVEPVVVERGLIEAVVTSGCGSI
jgi:hypothetical protein